VLVYATDAELGAWCNPLPDNADSLLRDASALVRKATRNDRYDVDAAGKPTDPDVIEAFRDATCKQVAIWAANDIDSNKGVAGLEQLPASSSIAGASVSYDGAVNAEIAAARAQSTTALAVEAVDILRDHLLASRSPGTW
jgi:hypothetical protein